MSIETKLNLTNDKFCQTDGSLLTLSGDTRISSVGTIRYETNQSGSYTSRSLTDAGYVTGLTTQLCTTANNGITKTNCNFYLGGALTGNTYISGNYTLNICGSAKLNSNNGYQINSTTVLNSPSNDTNSIFVGANAGATGNTGNNDIAIGTYTLRKLVFGAGGGHNIAIGSQSLCNSVNGCNNVAIGTSVMSASCTGSYNIGIGNQSLTRNCGNNNIGLGVSSLLCNRTGLCNIGVGLEALKLNFYGCQNIAIGNQTLFTNDSGNDNVAIGLGAGYSTTGNSSVFIGKYAGCSETGSNKLYIANNAANTLIYGDFLNNFVTLPTLKLCSTPGAGNTSDSILVWNSSDKCVKAISGGAVLTSAITGATNGLTKTGQNVKLGGVLTENTAIDGAGAYSLNFGGLTSQLTQFNVEATAINICAANALTLYGSSICLNNFATYNSNYCTSFTKYSLVDKNYVTGTTVSTANNGLTLNNRNVRLGGTITGDTCITYNNAKLAFCTEGGACNVVLCNLGSEVKLSSRCAYLISTSASNCQGNVGATNGCVAIFTNVASNGVQITAPSTGAIYTADYSSGFINESLVTKRYVTGVTSTSGVQSANNGLTKSGTNIRLGGALTGDTAITGAYSLGFNNSIINLTGSSCVNLSGAVKLITTPGAGSTSDSILVWNSSDKCVKAVSGGAVLTSAITGATNGLTKTGQNVKLGGTLTGNTTIGGSNTLCITAPSINTDVQHLTFDSNPTTPTAFGSLYYKNCALNFSREFSGVTLQIGEETVVRVINITGSAILNGSAVYICGAVGGLPTITKSIASNCISINTIGLTTMCIPDNNEGYVTILGQVHDIDTSSWSVGSSVYLSSTQSGCLTITPPVYPNEKIHLGYVTCQNANGSILVVPDVETPYTSIGTFTGYTASTAVVLSNKLDTCVFNNYTGTTTPTINSILDVTAFAVTGATNGLSKSGVRNVCLGGTISSPITVCGNSSIKFGDVCGITLSTQAGNDIGLNSKSCGGVYIKSQCGTSDSITNFACSIGIQVDYDAVNGFSVYDNRVGANQTGIVYAGDYSSNFVNRSLVDKAYVDSVATGLDVKTAAFVATTANITLSGLTTVDGITLTTGDRILVKDQTNGALNGIYSASTGTWGRVSDYDFSPSSEISNGDLIPVTTGNTNGNSIWILTTPNPITSGDTLIFSKFSQQAGVIDGNGINVTTVGTNKQISVELSPTACGLQFNGTGLEVDYDIFRLGLCCGAGGYVDVRATKGAASGSEIPVRINTGGTNTLYVDSSTISTCIGTPIITANNGLTKSGSNVRLGGTLTGATSINGGSNALTLSCISALGIGYTTSAIITDSSGTPRGLVYAGNYSATYCDRSLVDKAYVDGKVTSGTLACNGLTKVGDTVILGGALTGNTFISYGANRLCFINGGTSCIDVISDCSQIHVENTSLCLRSCTLGTCVGSVCVTNTGIVSLSSNAANCGVKITSSVTGAIYTADYSSGFINESLVTKRYVTGITSSICSGYICSANNGLTKSGTNVRLGGALTGNTEITGAYTLSVCGGAQLNTDKGYQVSGSTVLRTSPNSNTNILVGVGAGNSTMTGINNSAMGGYALYSNTIGRDNSAMGLLALYGNTTGCQNSAMGSAALYCNTSGCNNSAMGYQALYSNTFGRNNSAMGSQALYTNTTGCNNSAMGYYALYYNTTGCENSAMGCAALQNNATGCFNSAMGRAALYNNASGCFNSAMGNQALPNNTTGCFNSAMGNQALFSNNTVNKLIAIGTNALYNNKCVNASCQGCYNMAVGYGALSGNTYGCMNHAFGYGALSGNTTGCNNVASGYQALAKNSTGVENSAMGNYALNKNTTGSQNSAMGYATLLNNTSGNTNSAMGYAALLNNTCGNNNSAIGGYALYTNSTGSQNSAVGVNALCGNTTGCYNTAMGKSALETNSGGCFNTAMGYYALYGNTTGCWNSAMGYQTLQNNTTGCNNLAIGYRAGYLNSTGCLNVFIGTCAGYSETGSGKLYVATGATKSLVYGDFSTNEITLPKLKLCETPATGSSSDNVLVWNSSDKCVKQVNISTSLSSAITGATNGLTKTGQNVKLGGTLVENTAINGAYTIGFNNTYVNITGSTSVNISGAVKLLSTPVNGVCGDSVLVWNSTDKCVKKASSNGLFGIYSVTGVSSNATLSADNQVIFVDTTSGSVTITLPAAATISNGKVYMIKNTACGLLNNVIIDSGVSSTIDGSRCAIINTDYGALQLIRACTAGSNSIWYTLSFNN